MAYDIILGRDASDKKKFGKEGLIHIGKGYVTMGNYTSMSNNLYLDVARSHVILVAGKRGCLEGSTLVFTDKGYKPIEDFNKYEDKVLSFNKETKEFEWEKADLLEYPLENEDMLKIELEDGREIVLTQEHPLLSSYGKYIYWREAKELNINDKIVVPLIIPEIKKEDKLGLARLLGYILADGNINIRKGKFIDGRGYSYNGTKSRIRIFNADNEVLSQAKKDFEETFDIYAKRYRRNDCNCEVVQILDQRVVNSVIERGIPQGNKSFIIRIPEIVFQSSNEFKSQFVNALFSCDGYVPQTGRYVDYCSNSKMFLQDLQLLLTHFKIESSIRKKITKLNQKEFTSYRLFITDNNSVERFKKIGSIIKFKQERLNSHIVNNTGKRKTHYINEDLVCRKIKNITKITGINKVYDLTVPKNHSFIANGIISHNSGKSYTLGVITEEIANLPPEISRNIASIIFDTMGIFWTMKFKNEKEKSILEEWKLTPKESPVKVFAPIGKMEEYKEKNIPIDEAFALKASELEAEDWIITFNLSMTSQEGVLITNVVSQLKKEIETFTIQDIIKQINKAHNISQETKNISHSLFQAAESWGIFSTDQEGMEITDLINTGKTTIIDLSVYSSIGTFNIRGLVIGLVSRKIFSQRINARKQEEIQSIQHGIDYRSYNPTRETPLVWLFVDESHEFLPKNGKTPATDALVQILREGRQPGISLVLATQQPGQIHQDVMTQSDIIISHRVTAKPDIEALNQIMQTYLLESIKTSMDKLPGAKGSAIILDDNSERIYSMRMRPRLTWHGGESPSAVKGKSSL